MRRRAPAVSRNRDPILEVLRDVLPSGGGDVVEIASGTGEHVVHFARALPHLRFQPTDLDPDARRSIEAWRTHEGLQNVLPVLELDATQQTWPVARADAVISINMVHISPWTATLGLLAGASRLLPIGAPLYLYGPYKVDGQTAPSNEAFDSSLRARDPSWGVRDLRDLEAAARPRGLALEETRRMPANNLSVIFRRVSTPKD